MLIVKLVVFFFFSFWLGELFVIHTWTCNERNHKCQMEGHPQPKLQATLTTWVEADTKVCKEATCQAKQAAHKAVSHQPTAKPVHFRQTKHYLCLNQPNIVVKITTSRAYAVVFWSIMLTLLRARCPEPMLDMQSSTHGRLRRSYALLKSRKTMQPG